MRIRPLGSLSSAVASRNQQRVQHRRSAIHRGCEIPQEIFAAAGGAFAFWRAALRAGERLIWLGRRLAYLWRYREAIEVFSKGIALHPKSYKLLRHRGHRYITVREFDKAIADLEKAAKLIRNVPDETEPDGAPNQYNIPTSTSHSNVWYHLGLAYYLKGDFENALRGFLECMKFSKNDDMICATSDWLYMIYRRLGRAAEAQKVLDSIHENMNILENHAYHKRLLMYKG
ncbi:hypothetical protein DCC62_22425, partial [candidate division KSB1 bacterium]